MIAAKNQTQKKNGEYPMGEYKPVIMTSEQYMKYALLADIRTTGFILLLYTGIIIVLQLTNVPRW